MLNIIKLIKNTIFLVAYISNFNSFPKPLLQEEEKEYFALYKNTGNADAKNTLIERNLRLVVHISKKYPQCQIDKDDLIAIGTIGLMKGIESFDPARSSKLSTYISRCIENEMLMVIRGSKKNLADVSLNETIGVNKEGNKIPLISTIGTEENEVFNSINLSMEIKELYKNFDKELNQREKTVLKLRYGLFNSAKKTQREIAKILKISRSYVSRIEKKAITKLRKEYISQSC